MDIPELLRITDFWPSPPPRWLPSEAGEGVQVFAPPISQNGDATTLAGGEAAFVTGPDVAVRALAGRVALGRCPLA